MKDYYKLLGVSTKASHDEIKKAFRSLAQKYHPDKTQGDEAASKKFKEINEAYQTLSNSKSRSEYDFMRSGGGFRRGPHDFFGGFEDLFGDIFGRSRPRPQPRQRNTDEPAVRITATISELMSGKSKRTFKLVDEVKCNPCNGVGGDSRERCNNCRGTGKITKTINQGHVMFQTAHPCPNCQGTGDIILNVCRVCLGNGFTRKEELYDVFMTCKKR